MSGMVDPSSRPAAPRPFLVGRERERASLRQSLEDSIKACGSLVLISGEAGIGKTTLVEDLSFLASERDVLVLSGGCYDLATTPPFGPWLDAFSRYRPDAGLPSLPAFSGIMTDSGSAGNQPEFFGQVRAFLRSLALAVPLLLILEDLQWSDPSSLDLLRNIARDIATTRILLIATWRVDELDRRHHLYRLVPTLVRESGSKRIDLHRLDERAQRSLVTARYRLSDVDGDRLVTYLHQHAEGNPFYLTELLRALEEEGLLVSSGADGWLLADLGNAAVPELVRQVIEARVSRLGEDVRDILEVASVLGYDVPLDLWTELIDVDHARLLQIAERVVDARMLIEIPPNGYRFSHALVREAIYDGIVLPRRQALHRRIGEQLAARSNPDPATIAHHFQRAADHRAAEWLLRAGEQARRRFAPRDAVDRLTLALTAPDGLTAEERAHAYLERGRAYETLGEFASAVNDANTALDLARKANSWQLEWQALLDLGAAWSPRNYDQAGDYYRQALELARAHDDPAVVATSLNRLGNWYFNMVRLREALDLHQEALAIFDVLDDLPRLADTHDCLAMSWWGSGDSFRAAGHWDAAIALFERLGDRQRLASSLVTSAALSLIDFYAVAARPVSYAINQNERGLALAREIGWRPGEIFGLMDVGRLQLLCGEVSAGLETLDQALAVADSIEHREWSSACWTNIGLGHYSIHDLDGARSALERALQFAREIGSGFHVSLAAKSLARTLIDLGELEAADELLDHEFGQRGRNGGPDGTLQGSHQCWARASLMLARGDAAGALALVDAGIDVLPNTDRGVVPALWILRGEALLALGRLFESREAFVAARDRLAEYDERVSRLVACARIAEISRALGLPADAELADAEAREIATFVGEHISDTQLRLGFEAYVDGLLATDRQVETSTLLSPREVEVLRLVAEGLTDIEVARRLYLSRRTISSHLRSIYGKLGVSTRTAAARLAIERHYL